MKFFNALFLLIPFFVFQNQLLEPATYECGSDIITIDNIETVAKSDNKKVIIKLSAEWCKPCKKLSKTLEDKEIQSYLKNNFHIVDFDIQTKESITYKGKSYDYVDDPKMGYHALAYELLENRLSFPALLVLDTDLKKLDLTRGYKNKRQLLEYLKEI